MNKIDVTERHVIRDRTLFVNWREECIQNANFISTLQEKVDYMGPDEARSASD
jgi:hypothetical protein